MNKKEKLQNRIFIGMVALCFLTVFVFEMLTPMLMDDMTYSNQVKEAGSFFQLFGQEYTQYMGWTGRSVAHMSMRILMYLDLHILGGGRLLFNIVAALVFTRLSILMYTNIQKKNKVDVKTYVLIVLLLWIFGISFAQTVLWETGACNYLITTTLIWEFITFFRRHVEEAAKGTETSTKSSVVTAILMFLSGLIAGWCNENTSGGCLLMVILLTAFYLKGKHKIKPFMITGILGNVMGLAIMVLAPGNMLRAANREELHGGLLGMAARFLNITIVIHEEFFILLSVLIALVIYLLTYGKKLTELIDVFAYTGLWFATSYSLIATTTPQSRAFFGAGIFLMMAVVQAYQDADDDVKWMSILRKSVVYILCLYMFFTYLESGGSLARIYREEQERYTYLEEYAKTGEEDVEVPMLRPNFKTKYSAAYDSDVTDDWTYWTNMMMAEYYGFKTLLGVDREEWTKY
ncbi:MAG: hypothetical protein E7302_00355 [Butyrivibrio sp.]|nr:hypothetical protein [Butyrivibrio sp.]